MSTIMYSISPSHLLSAAKCSTMCHFVEKKLRWLVLFQDFHSIRPKGADNFYMHVHVLVSPARLYISLVEKIYDSCVVYKYSCY